MLGLLMIFMFFWGLFFTLAALGAGGIASLFLFAVAWGPLAFTIWMVRRGNHAARARFDDALAAAGFRSDHALFHYENRTGISVDPEGKRVFLLSGNKSKVYGYADIRSWESRKGGRSGMVVGGGAAGAAAGVAAGLGDAQRMAAETGFYVFVRDIENPKWRVSMQFGDARAKWMEIMEQAISEDGVKTGGH